MESVADLALVNNTDVARRTKIAQGDLLNFLKNWDYKNKANIYIINNTPITGQTIKPTRQPKTIPFNGIILIGEPGVKIYAVKARRPQNVYKPLPYIPVKFVSHDSKPVPIIINIKTTYNVISTIMTKRLKLPLKTTDIKYYNFNTASPRSFIGTTQLEYYIGNSIAVIIYFYMAEIRPGTQYYIFNTPFIY